MIEDIKILKGSVRPCAVKKYKVFCSKPDPFLNQLATLIAIMMNSSIAVVNVIDKPSAWGRRRQYSRERKEEESGSGFSSCSLAILNEQVMNFRKMVDKPHLFSNPLLVGEYGCRYFVMVPINSNRGLNVGSICVADSGGRDFTTAEKWRLEQAVDLVKTEMSNRYR
ncbi:GAF domain-containing protein [Pedobacter gandavensis]|uniref:GAF domain-containing protein n=1 Tax=Pedobacter gandavensis TaxID=2679963 RepID=UPI00292DDBE3|nr:GAF domain-containing protein [Pedobacter gandavensis]